MKITTRDYADFQDYVTAFNASGDLVIFYRAQGTNVMWAAAISKTLDKVVTCESSNPITTVTQFTTDYASAVQNSFEVAIMV